ncbi:hypothetical protein C806_04131 [Lachnospiraceae bacterium 3-1]|nr:hypothetical protein C806_04131 [Lachnospiraceae bacterium 3-1]
MGNGKAETLRKYGKGHKSSFFNQVKYRNKALYNIACNCDIILQKYMRYRKWLYLEFIHQINFR